MARNQTVDRGPSAPVKPYNTRDIPNGEVDEPSASLVEMLPDIHLIEDLLGGTRAMREAGRDHLPQHEYESDKAYRNRLEGTVLDNHTDRTLNTLVGKALKEPPQPGEEFPEAMLDFLDDVDDAGMGLVPFVREWFRAGVREAVAHCFVDMPEPPQREDGAPRNKADDARAGLRPYWRIIPACQMLDFQLGKVTMADGTVKTVPTLIRFKDDAIEPVGLFGSQLVRRRKVLRHTDLGVTWEMWELQEKAKRKPEWVQVTPPSPYGLKRIPIVTFYTNRTGPGEGRPVLTDLAELNRRHWQSTSDQTNILTVTRFPILAASGVRDTESADGQAGQLVVGPNKFLTTPDPQSKVYYVEHTGAAVESGEKDLDRLGAAMGAYGSQFLKKGAQGPESASGRVLDEAESISPLQSWGMDFKDCLELAGYFTALWMGLPDTTKTPFDFEVEAEVDLTNPAELAWLTASREKGDMSREASLDEAKRRGILPEDFDIDADKERIDAEPPPPGGGLDGMATGLRGAKAPIKPK